MFLEMANEEDYLKGLENKQEYENYLIDTHHEKQRDFSFGRLYILSDNEDDLMLQAFIDNLNLYSDRFLDNLILIDHDPEALVPISIVLLFVTNKLVQCENYNEWVKKAKKLKHYLIGLLVEELINNDKIKDNFYDEFIEIYKARFNPTGFDCFLWISDHIENLIGSLGNVSDNQVS